MERAKGAAVRRERDSERQGETRSLCIPQVKEAPQQSIKRKCTLGDTDGQKDAAGRPTSTGHETGGAMPASEKSEAWQTATYRKHRRKKSEGLPATGLKNKTARDYMEEVAIKVTKSFSYVKALNQENQEQRQPRQCGGRG